ncbi:hypothetical protein ACFVHB_18180 [Kitasatospora sp. NPDC127111]|uniref:hypothetical protein n=1 Tax=Kitasatospora sp. NPDC127111 TaxID=3345363 RepID=UPI00362C3752
MGKRLASCFVLTALATAVMAGPASAATATAPATAAATVTVRTAAPTGDQLIPVVPKTDVAAALRKAGKGDGDPHNDLRWE